MVICLSYERSGLDAFRIWTNTENAQLQQLNTANIGYNIQYLDHDLFPQQLKTGHMGYSIDSLDCDVI